MRKSTNRRVSARAMLGPALAMSLAFVPCVAGAQARADVPARAAGERPAAENSAAKPEAEDYYSRRARETVERDQMFGALPLHPLAAAYPGHTVVICAAGCSREHTAEIVYMTRAQSPEDGATSQMIPTSSDAARDVAQGPQTIDCLGGCYDTPKRYPALAPPVAEARAVTIGSWETTVARDGAAPEPIRTTK